VFLWVGLLTLGRVLGAFANLGWAWNVRPPSSTNASAAERFFNCSMEMVESSLIFIYGITNVFMEHLGNRDGKWSHKDLQHVSIAFMYIGGGLGGLLFESHTVRRFLAPIRSRPIHLDQAVPTVTPASTEPKQYSFSYNPFPAFTIFWTGILMSQHRQATELSTMIHMQWGYLLAIGAILRILTYTIFYLSPPVSHSPSRPLTEILVAFCLMAGGAIFMASNEETVGAMIYWGLDAMFIMNITVGVTALVICWTIILLALKGWASRRAP